MGMSNQLLREERAERVRRLRGLLGEGLTQGEAAVRMGLSRESVSVLMREVRAGEVRTEPEVGGVELGEVVGDEKLRKLRQRAARGLDTGPEWDVVLAQAARAKVQRDMESGVLDGASAASALAKCSAVRRAAEDSIDMRERLLREVCRDLLWACRAVVGADRYEEVVRKLESVR